MPWFDEKLEDDDSAPANPLRFWDRALGVSADGAKTRSWKIPGPDSPLRIEAPHEEFFATLNDVGIAGLGQWANPPAPSPTTTATVSPPLLQPEGFAAPAPALGGTGLTTLIGDRAGPTATPAPTPPALQPEGFAPPASLPPESKPPAGGFFARRLDSLGAIPKAPSGSVASIAPPPEAPAAQPEGFAAPAPAAPETPAPDPASVSPFMWMLRTGLGLRGLAGDFGRRWGEKPLTAADADDPDAAAKSVGAAAENEMRVVAGAYRPLVPPGARAAYDRSTAEAAKSANKQAADAVRARARAAHETGTRATLAEVDRALAAEHDEAIRNGDHPRAETLTAQRDDLRRFTQAYLRPAPAAPTDELPKAQPVSSDPVPTPVSTEPVKADPAPTPPAAAPASSEPAPQTEGFAPSAPPAAGSPEELEARIDQDGRALDSDFDTSVPPGEPSRLKKAFALLRHADHPAFDTVARRLGYDPQRLRAVAKLLTFAAVEHDAVYQLGRAAAADHEGNVNDYGFEVRFWVALDSIKRALDAGTLTPRALADLRAGHVLALLRHTTTSAQWAEMTRNTNLAAPGASLVAKAIDALGDSVQAAHLRVLDGIDLFVVAGLAQVLIGRHGEKVFQEHLSRRFVGSRYEIRVHQNEISLGPPDKRIMDVHVVDRRTGEVILRYEVKTNSGRPTKNQKTMDKKLLEQGKPVHYVKVYTADQKVFVNGLEIRDYWKTLSARTGSVVVRRKK